MVAILYCNSSTLCKRFLLYQYLVFIFPLEKDKNSIFDTCFCLFYSFSFSEGFIRKKWGEGEDWQQSDLKIEWECREKSWRLMRKSFKDSLKSLEADIQHANTLASDYPEEYDGACLQMRLSYSPCAHIFLFLVQWADCHLAGALGLIRILIYKACKNGKTTMYINGRKASIREFYGVIFPSVMQLHRGITDGEERQQREMCGSKYKRRDEVEKGKVSEIEVQREEECGICMEINTKVVLPNCSHSLCMKCYRDWRARSESCPFCRDSLKRMDSGELWIYTSKCDIIDMPSFVKENLKRLLMYVDKLPLIVPDPTVVSHDPRF